MLRIVEREDQRMRQRYTRSPRHTIQVDFYPYLRTIQKERRRGRRWLGGLLATRAHELRLGAEV